MSTIQTHVPTRKAEIANDKRQTTIYLLALAILAPVLTTWYMLLDGLGMNHAANLPAMVDRSAAWPFVTRRLAPELVSSLAPLVGRLQAADIFQRLALDKVAPGYPALGMAAYQVLCLSMIMTMAGILALASAIGLTGWRRWAAVPLALVGIFGPFASYNAYIYDLPTLALIVWGLVFIASDHYNAYLIILALATYSKETAVLLIPVWLLLHWKERRWFQIAEQIGVYITVRGIVLFSLANTPNHTLMEIHLADHLKTPVLFPFTWITITLGILIALYFCLRRWPAQPPILRAGFVGLCLPMAGLYVVGGMPMEFRALLECMPIILLMILGGIRHA